MKLMSYIYKTSTLQEYGKIILGLLVLMFIVGKFVIKDFEPKSGRQIFSLNGNHVKFDDEAIVDDFFNSIKSNDGYLCLGTSESTSLKFGNYFNFLNADDEIKSHFSVLAGAGRTCGTYIPLFINHKEKVKGLKVIYMINPVYWRQDLCRVSKEYWARYVSLSSIRKACKGVNIELKEVNEYLNALNPFEKLVLKVGEEFRKFRSNYNQNFLYNMDSSKYYKGVSYISNNNQLSDYKNLGEIDIEEIDTIWNIERTFTNKHWFKQIDTDNDYRYRELKLFNEICEEFEVDITYVISPVNYRFIRNYASSDLKQYIITTNNIIDYLNEVNASYIDGTDISDLAGAFNDHQHFSSYGAFLIYQKMKSYINEEVRG